MKIDFYQETAIPGTWEAGGVYFIKPTTPPVGAPANYCEVYIVDHTGAVTAHTPTWGEINANIASQIAATGSLVVVDDIAARDAIASPSGEVYVKDASADTTVNAGGARYLWDATASDWVKTSETESMDLVLNWANIIDKPTATASDIDDAVTKRHTHANKTQLDKISEDAQGNITYGGSAVKTQWTTNGW